MTSPRILVSYHLTRATRPSYGLIPGLIADLRAAGADIVIDECDHASADVSQAIYQQMQHCKWVILVETPELSHSVRARALIQMARYLVDQRHLLGVLRVIATPYRAQEVPPTWVTLRRFDASKDYSRALAGVLLEIGLGRSANIGGVRLGAAPPPVVRPRMLLSSFMGSFAQLVHTPRLQRLGLIALAATITLLLLSSVATLLVASAKSNTATSRPTVTTAQDQSPSLPGRLVFNDPLTQQDANWMDVSDNGASCTFRERAYHVEVLRPQHRLSCMAHVVFVSDFAFQVKMMLITGDMGGLTFRSSASDSVFYHFYLYADGHYVLYLRSDPLGIAQTLATGSLNIDIHQLNVLGVVARGDHLMLYVNHTLMSEVHDNTLNAGFIGLVAKDITQPTDVVFTNAILRKL